MSSPKIVIDPELAAFVPALQEAEFEALKTSIIEEGQRDALILWGDILVDGHHRLKILQSIKPTPKIKTIRREFSSKAEVKEYMIKLHLARRSLNLFQKFELCSHLEESIREKAKENQRTSTGGTNPQLRMKSDEAEPVNVIQTMAKLTGMSPSSVHQCRYLVKHSSQQVRDLLRRGETSLNSAYAETRRMVSSKERIEKKIAKVKPDPSNESKGEKRFEILQGDAIQLVSTLEDLSVQTLITSPPYWRLRKGDLPPKLKGLELGNEKTVDEYLDRLIGVFVALRPKMRKTGTLWVNLGDTYDKEKNLEGIPWRFALKMKEKGFLLRADVVWAKNQFMPQPVLDRPTISHEYVFLFSLSRKYFYDADAIREPFKGKKGEFRVPSTIHANTRVEKQVNSFHSIRERQYDLGKSGKNKRSVWFSATENNSTFHHSAFPESLVEPCVLAGSASFDEDPNSSLCLDPFAGSGTVGAVCVKRNRRFRGFELSPDFVEKATERLNQIQV